MMDSKEKTPVSGAEHDHIARALLNWFNQYDNFPARVETIESGYLDSGTSMALFSVEAPYKTQPYINGSYTAQYPFALQYRIAGSNSNQRLNAMGVLSGIADWAEGREDLPALGKGKHPISIEHTSLAIMIARYEDGSEDYQILMTFMYKVDA